MALPLWYFENKKPSVPRLWGVKGLDTGMLLCLGLGPQPGVWELRMGLCAGLLKDSQATGALSDRPRATQMSGVTFFTGVPLPPNQVPCCTARTGTGAACRVSIGRTVDWIRQLEGNGQADGRKRGRNIGRKTDRFKDGQIQYLSSYKKSLLCNDLRFRDWKMKDPAHAQGPQIRVF